MQITSKFNSRCKRCNEAILIGDVISWERGVGATHLTITECAAAKAKAATVRPSVVNEKLDPIAKFLQAARDRGLERPKLRVLGVDGKSELTLSVTTKGKAPGSLVVKIDRQYIGLIRPDGGVIGDLRARTDVQDHLLAVATNPTNAAKEYAQLTGACSFCGKALTDAGSIAVGYGPVCARHWGLPHMALGTPELGVVPQVVRNS